jgi:hypothetical protein
VSSQSEQPAVKTSIFLLPAISIHLPLVGFVVYIPVQQHLSSVLPVSLQRNFPSFCVSQQHGLTSLPVRVHTSFGEAADATAATAIAANNGSDFVIDFINFTSFDCLTSFLYTLEPGTGSNDYLLRLLSHFLHLFAATAARILIAAFPRRSAFRHLNLAAAFRIGALINFTFFKSHRSSPPFVLDFI